MGKFLKKRDIICAWTDSAVLQGSFYYLIFEKSIFLLLHFSIGYVFKNIKQKEYYIEQGSLIKYK